MNQKIVNSSEILSLLLDVLSAGKQPARALSAVFVFLRNLARGYPKVQKRLFENLDRILNARGTERGYEYVQGQLLAEIFNENSDVTIEVKPSQVYS